MFNQYRMVLLGLIVVQGANLVAMDSPKKGGSLSDSGKKVVAGVQVLTNAGKNPLGCSAEFRKEEESTRNNGGSAGCLVPRYDPYTNRREEKYSSEKYSSMFPGINYYVGY
jgi:hypothetical protein